MADGEVDLGGCIKKKNNTQNKLPGDLITGLRTTKPRHLSYIPMSFLRWVII